MGGNYTRIFVTDFDGTVTSRDFYLLVARQYTPTTAPSYWDQYARGQLTHFEAMRGFFSHAPTDPASLERLLEETDPDPELGPSIQKLQHRGWEIVFASAGSDWYIYRILERAGVQNVRVWSNPGTIEDGRGLHIRLPEDSPFYSPEVGVDKAAIVRDALSRADIVAFAGDGPPDLEPALLVPPDLRFAKGWLATELERRREPFRAFDRWSEIARVLENY